MKITHTSILLSEDSARLLSAMVGHFLGEPHEQFFCSEVVIEREPIDLSVYTEGELVTFCTTSVIGDDRAQVVAVSNFSNSDLPFESQPFVAISTREGVSEMQAGHLLRRFSSDRHSYRVTLSGQVRFWSGDDCVCLVTARPDSWASQSDSHLGARDA